MFFSFNDKSAINIMTNAVHTVYTLTCSVSVKIYWRKINYNYNYNQNHYVKSGVPQHDRSAQLCIDAGGNHIQHLL